MVIRGGLVTIFIACAQTINTIGAKLLRCKVQSQSCNFRVVEAIIERVLAESGTTSDTNCGWNSRPAGLRRVMYDEAEHNTSCMQQPEGSDKSFVDLELVLRGARRRCQH